MRFLLWIIAGCALGVGVGFLIAGLGPTASGVWIAVAAGLVLVVEGVNAVRRDRRRLRRGRDATWQRRIADGIAGARPTMPNAAREPKR